MGGRGKKRVVTTLGFDRGVDSSPNYFDLEILFLYIQPRVCKHFQLGNMENHPHDCRNCVPYCLNSDTKASVEQNAFLFVH